MNAVGIIALSAGYGVTLTATSTRIIARPAAKLTPELRNAIRGHSAELVKVLTDDNRSARLDPDAGAPGHEADRRREVSRVPRGARQNDRRSTASDPCAQSGAYASPENIEPIAACPVCGSGQWWQARGGEPWHCRACKPDMPLTATTLTLCPCHKPPMYPVRDARLCRIVELACRGLTITPELYGQN